MLARDQGATLASIATVVQRPLTAIVSLGDKHITTPRQLRGKTVGDTGIGYENAFLQTILTQAGVPAGSVKEVDVGTNLVGAMLSGRVDATLGADWNDEAIQLAQDGRHTNVIHVEDAGVPTYDELVVVTTETEIANHNNELRRFIQALGRGYEAARADPQAAVANLVRANPGLDAKLALASAEATMSSFFPPNANANLPWGWQNGAQWTTFGEWMLHHHLISNPAAIPNTSTNQLLAGQGP
jgi:putative hydroxymethylpyrimidine transport system substrate-binding protein